MAEEAEPAGPVRDLYLPLAMLAVGVALRAAELLWTADGSAGNAAGPSVGRAVGLMACETVIAAAAVAAGLLAVAGWMGTALGAPGTAALKGVATAVLLGAVGYAAAGLDPDPAHVNGMIAAWHLVVLGYFVLYATLFRLDLTEALAATAITTLLQLGLLAAVAATLTTGQARALFFGG